jgi:hypothetical protein
MSEIDFKIVSKHLRKQTIFNLLGLPTLLSITSRGKGTLESRKKHESEGKIMRENNIF